MIQFPALTLFLIAILLLPVLMRKEKLVNTMSMLSGGVMSDGTVTSRSPPETEFLHSKFK